MVPENVVNSVLDDEVEHDGGRTQFQPGGVPNALNFGHCRGPIVVLGAQAGSRGIERHLLNKAVRLLLSLPDSDGRLVKLNQVSGSNQFHHVRPVIIVSEVV